MIYVDDPIFPYRNMMMCHMMADDLSELHLFAGKLGLKREWFQNNRHPHYDISISKRKLAVQLGAKEVSSEFLIGLKME